MLSNISVTLTVTLNLVIKFKKIKNKKLHRNIYPETSQLILTNAVILGCRKANLTSDRK